MKSPYDPIEERDQDRPDKRAEWNMKGREAPKGQSAAALRYRAHQQKMAMRARAATAAAARQAGPSAPAPFGSGPGWVALGPAPLVSDAGTGQDYGLVTGRSTAIAIDPSDPTGATVYGAGAYGGLWKTTNGTAVPETSVTWTPVTDQQPSLAIGAVSVKPDGTVVLVGTGEPNNAIDSYYGVGILRSTDGGTTWTSIPTANGGSLSFFGLGFTKFAWKTGSNTVVAASATTAVGFDEGAINGATKRGLYLSTDAGQTWTYQALSDGSTPISVSDVVYDDAAGMFFASVRFLGIYSSTNGTNWTRLTNQPSNLTTANCPVSESTACPLYRGQLAVTPGRDEMYFWFIDINISDQGVWRTTNHGQTWTRISETGFSPCSDGVNNGCGAQQAFYNMDLMAVPNGSATDLYLGAVNLFKCSLPNNSATSCSGGSWLNLTHVYACNGTPTPHPDEHGIDSKIVGGKAIVYIGNDGGFYRALDGFTGLTSNNCGGNSWDDLNSNMGSMTQFVSFSIHPTDQKTVLGGTQDNGSPATASATTSTNWSNVNAGDGGYNEINPTNATQWFTANTDVSIQKCGTGITCSALTFLPVVSAGDASIGGDSGAFYTPYILDPQNASELIVGTCRVWRGSTTNFSGSLALSSNFDTGSGSCTGGETNLVRGLAAGGPKVGNLSSVVYATTQGTGPNGGASGGQVWATTNAGSAMMTNVTHGINPSGYTISSVAIDKSDATGKTAFVGIMGFHVSHVFKTTNAGGAWTDWTGTGGGALPDAPVNAILVDSSVTPHQIYAGTDVGVFVSSTTSPSWSEVGPNAQPGGAAGYLPNVPVTAIRLFSSGATKKLRVSTYGRGIWEFDLNAPPDFTNTVSDSPQTIFPTQTATFHGAIAVQGGYNSAVNLSCGGIPPSTCTLNPTQEPAPGSGNYTVTAGDVVGDYIFNAHAVGTDTNTTTHDAAITLHVVDFNLTAPSPNTLTVPQGGTSGLATFNVTALGSFNGTVSLSCQGLPSGALCQFTPSADVTPTSGSPVQVTLTVRALNSTPTAGSPYTVTLSATTPNAPAAKTKTFQLTVIPPIPDFDIAVAATGTSTIANQNLVWNGTVTATNNYSGSVTLSCTTGKPATCNFSPNPVTASASGAPFTLTVGSPTTGTFHFNVLGTDETLTHIFPATSTETLTVSTDVSVPPTLVNTSVKAGQLASTSMSLAPIGGGTFSADVSYTCSGLPAGLSCTFSPVSIAAGQAATNVGITISTNGPFSRTRPAFRSEKRSPWLPLSMPLAGVVLVGLAGMPRRYKIIGLCMAVALTALMAACGGGGSSPPPPPPISVTVTPNAVSTLYPALPGSDPAKTTQKFSARVNNDVNQSVIWAVSGGSANGTIDSTGLYTAPSAVPAGPVTVTATSADTATPGSATVNIQTPTTSGTYPVTVTVTEATNPQTQHVATFNLTVQ